jgi:hypothetical protein
VIAALLPDGEQGVEVVAALVGQRVQIAHRLFVEDVEVAHGAQHAAGAAQSAVYRPYRGGVEVGFEHAQGGAHAACGDPHHVELFGVVALARAAFVLEHALQMKTQRLEGRLGHRVGCPDARARRALGAFVGRRGRRPGGGHRAGRRRRCRRCRRRRVGGLALALCFGRRLGGRLGRRRLGGRRHRWLRRRVRGALRGSGDQAPGKDRQAFVAEAVEPVAHGARGHADAGGGLALQGAFVQGEQQVRAAAHGVGTPGDTGQQTLLVGGEQAGGRGRGGERGQGALEL